MQEPPGVNPDWLGEVSSFSIKNFYISLKVNFQKSFDRLVAEI